MASKSGRYVRDKLGRFAGTGSSGSIGGKDLGPNDRRLNVTLSDPNHTMVTMRKTTINKNIVVRNEPDSARAKLRAKKFYQKRGYKVHDIME